MLDVEESSRIGIEEIIESELFFDENTKEKAPVKKILNRTGVEFSKKYSFVIRSLKKSLLLKRQVSQQLNVFSSEKFSIGTGFKLQPTKGSVNRLSKNLAKKDKNEMASICDNMTIKLNIQPSINNLVPTKSSKFKTKGSRSFFAKE